MKGKNKKIIALLATFCLATAATAMAGCVDKPTDSSDATVDAKIKEVYQLYVANAEANGEDAMSYEAWLASIKGEKGDKGDQGEKGDKGDKGEDGKDATMHEHSTEGEMVVLVPATGYDVGYGAIVCPDCGSMTLVEIPVLEGVIKQNPIALNIGDSKEVLVNTYDAEKYGEDPARGEKNVMYFAVTVKASEESGYVALPVTDLPEGVQANYTFYRTSAFAEDEKAYSRLVNNTDWDENWNTIKVDKSLYIKVELTADEGVEIPATITVQSQLTVLNDENHSGKAKHVIKLPEGVAAEDVKVYDAWGYEVTLYEDGEVDEGSIGDYKAFNGSNVAEVWLEPGNYTFEIVGLNENYYLIDADQCTIAFTDDGKYDNGGSYEISVGKQYKYNFTVTDSADAPVANATVILSNLKTGATETYTTDENGQVSAFVKENYDETGAAVFDYIATVTDLPFGNVAPDVIALSLDTKDVTIKAEEAELAAWNADGTAYDAIVAGDKTPVWAKLTVAEDSKYRVDLSYTYYMCAYDSYSLTIGENTYTLGNSVMSQEVDLTAGTYNVILAAGAAMGDVQISFTKIDAASAAAWAADGTKYVVLDKDTDVKSTSASLTVTQDGDYTVALEGTNPMLSYMTITVSIDGTTYTLGNGGALSQEVALTKGDHSVTVSASVVFGTVSISFTQAGGGSSETSENVLVLNTPTEVEESPLFADGTEVGYTFTAVESGVYKLELSGSWAEYAIVYEEYEYKYSMDPSVIIDAQEKINNTFSLEAGASITLYFVSVGTGTTVTVTLAGSGSSETSENVLVLDTPKTVSDSEGYTFTASVAGTYVFTPSGENGLSADLWTQAAYDAWGEPFASSGSAGTLTLAAGETVELYFTNGGAGSFTLTVTLAENENAK